MGRIGDRRIAVADVETTPFRHGRIPKTWFWGLATEGEDYRRFNTTSQLMQHLGAVGNLTVYTHHDFDMVQAAFVDGAKLFVRSTRSGRILSAQSHDTVEWRNSYAVFPDKLEKVLESCGWKKPGLDSIEERNYVDCVGGLASFLSLSAQYERIWGVAPIGDRYLTQPAAAFAAAKLRAGPLPIWLENRDAYRGGRTEAFRIGQCGDVDLYDINSTYPYSILDAPARDELLYCAVDVGAAHGIGPLFQLREDRERKLLFPFGRFTTAFFRSNYERYIAHHPGVSKVKILHRVPVDFTWLGKLKGLVREVYALRRRAARAGNASLAYVCKIGLNCIYGRMGLRAEREVMFHGPKLPNGDEISYYEVPQGYLAFKNMPSKPTANYLFAAFITDNARARLYDALVRAKSPFYCDTDSIAIPTGTVPDFPVGGDIGDWKLEKQLHAFRVNTLKDYSYRTPEGVLKVKRKGGAGGYEWTMKRAAAGKAVAVKTRTRRTPYDKRVQLPSGATLPLICQEW